MGSYIDLVKKYQEFIDLAVKTLNIKIHNEKLVIYGGKHHIEVSGRTADAISINYCKVVKVHYTINPKIIFFSISTSNKTVVNISKYAKQGKATI